MNYDALLVLSFGGPERSEDVLPFLENVTRGRNIPRERLLEVAEHYYRFAGKSPLNDQCRELIAALRSDFDANGIALPIYWGNRNWHPLLPDTLDEMRRQGVKRALAFVTSAYASYSGCRQYRENIAAARSEVGPGAPEVDKLRLFYNHPSFIEACADRVRDALKQFDTPPRVAVTAHSMPESMARTSDYETQLSETSRLVCSTLRIDSFDLVYQSRSGHPSQPWLGPDILDHLRDLHGRGVDSVLLAPLGFLSDHMEVVYDLDTEAMQLASELRMNVVRSATVGSHPAFVRMIRQLVLERIRPGEKRLAIGEYGPSHDICLEDCCPAPSRAGKPPVWANLIASPRS